MFTHSTLMPNQAQAADGDVTVDLPVNPLSVILLHISPLNETGTIGNYRLLEALLGAVTNIRVSHKGAAVIEERSSVGGVVSFWFTHAFFRQTLYEETFTPRRIRLHRQVGEALEQVYSARLAEHASEMAELRS